MLGVQAAALALYYQAIRAQDVDIGFAWFLVAPVVLMGITIYYLIRSYFNHPFRFIARANAVRAYDVAAPRSVTTQAQQDEIDRAFENRLIETYAEDASHNSVVNDAKSAYFHRANTFFVYLGNCGYSVRHTIRDRVTFRNSSNT